MSPQCIGDAGTVRPQKRHAVAKTKSDPDKKNNEDTRPCGNRRMSTPLHVHSGCQQRLEQLDQQRIVSITGVVLTNELHQQQRRLEHSQGLQQKEASLKVAVVLAQKRQLLSEQVEHGLSRQTATHTRTDECDG